jgi:hypothetical protein
MLLKVLLELEICSYIFFFLVFQVRLGMANEIIQIIGADKAYVLVIKTQHSTVHSPI